MVMFSFPFQIVIQVETAQCMCMSFHSCNWLTMLFIMSFCIKIKYKQFRIEHMYCFLQPNLVEIVDGEMVECRGVEPSGWNEP